MGIEPAKIGVIIGVNTNTERAFVATVLQSFLITELTQRVSVRKKIVFLTVGVNHIVKFRFELVRLQIIAVIVPSAEKSFSVCIHVRTKIPNESALHGNLFALPIGILLFRFFHYLQIKTHYLSFLSSFLAACKAFS